MAADIVPIELGLTTGNVVTLWAPRWKEDGEEWEAFLGQGDHIYVFPDTAHLAAFIRTESDHDLADHPEWAEVPDALVDQLEPSDERKFDLVGVPELVSGPPDIWTVAELADTIAILRSLADVCDVEAITDVLDDAEGFDVLSLGESAFIGRAGERLWTGIGRTVVKRWDEVIDAVDALVATPDVDPEALAQARAEFASMSKLALLENGGEADEEFDETAEPTGPRSPDLEFWDEIGIDCISITIDGKTGYSLRCYIDDAAVFLSEAGRIQLFTSKDDFVQYLSSAETPHSLAKLEAFGEIRDAAAEDDLRIAVAPENAYVIDGLMQQLIRGPEEVDRRQLRLAVELLRDAAAVRSDDETIEALSTATPLGWLIAAVLKPTAGRLPPTPPFTDEVTAWNVLVESFTESLEWHPAE